MQYKTIQRKERINKWLSVMLIYALFFQELIPFVHSMNEIEFGETLKVNESAVNASLFENKILNSKNLKEKNRGIENFDELEEQEISLAVSGGPGQTESSGFSLGTTDGLVDKFTGDFTYSIPLMSVEGYPIVINYNSNVGMNTEASWVGLGWDLNVGSISREMRGLPDEFNGDQKIVRKINQLESTNDGGKFGGYVAWSKPSALFDYNNFPTVQLTALFGGYQNTYTGFGKTFDFGLQSSISIGEDIQFAPSFGTGFSIDSKNGLGKNSNYGLSLSGKKKTESGASMGMGGSLTYGKNYNSRAGIINKSLGFGANGNYSGLRGNSLKPSYGTSTALMYGSVTSVPSNRYNGTGSSFRFQLDLSNEKKMKNVLFTAGIITQIYTSTNSVDFGDAAHSQSQEIDQPAYGYLHSSKRKNAKSDELALMDFNRTNDFEYSEEMKNLAFSFQTYDIFRASALGMSGTFRARRNDVGTYYDPNVKNETNGNSVDVSAGNIVLSELEPFTNKVGLAYGHQDGDAESGNWHLSGDENILNFETEDSGNSFDESTYFKALGESTVEDLSALEALGGEQVSHFPTVETISNNIGQSSVLKNEDGTSTLPLDGNNINNSNERPIVATCFLPNTAEQAASSSSVYQSHEENDFLSGNTTSINRIDENNDRDRNHISSIEIVSADGLQYTYGIPAYTLESSQVSFAVGSGAGLPEGRPVDPETNLVRYNLSDNGISNQLGRGHNYDKTTTPAYAHSFLLTEMRSSDYVDLGEPGLSVNDIGSYYKINHTQYYWKTSQGGSDPRPSNPYRWRFPISDDQGTQAFHNEGFEGSNLDDMANYTYGEKEIWYTHSVESKNFVAEFVLEDRDDACGVLDENGKLDADAKLKRLAKIVLYNRSERRNKGGNAIPLQTVEFIYDYSLCKNAPGNIHTYSANSDHDNSGKLTLKGIRVYSGNSVEGGLSKYAFNYATGDQNPEFNYADVDGWGNFKENDPSRPNHILPYASQNDLEANANINAWKLMSIENPMGGKIEVTYEADRYVRVQNKRPMKHLDIYGMTNLIEFLHIDTQSEWDMNQQPVSSEFRKDFGGSGLLDFFSTNGYSNNDFQLFANAAILNSGFAQYPEEFGRFDGNFVPNNVIVFKLEEALSNTDYSTKEEASQFVRDAYFKNGNGPTTYLDELLFKMHVNVKTEDNETIREFIPAFAKISKDYNHAFSGKLPFDDGFSAIGVMPPEVAGGDYEYGYVVVDPVNSGARELKNSKGNDKNGVLLHPLQRSALDFVRQNLPDQVYGSCDGCDTDLSIDAAAFFGGDIYEYMINAGYVASFEQDYSTMRLYAHNNQKYGGDARVQKITYKDNWSTISNEYDSEYSWFYEYKSAEDASGVASYEPGAIIDESPFYRWDTYVNASQKFPDETKFTPTPITGALFPIPTVGYASVNVRFSGGLDYGYSKAEFYTANDFPTVEKVTTIDINHVKRRNILSGNSVDLFGLSQGFIIETNDFHGKPKEFLVYDKYENVQSRSTYIYNDLNEKVAVIDREGIVESENIAMEYDIHADARFSTNESRSLSFGLELKFNPTFAPFMLLPTFSRQKREQGFFSNTLVKHINRSAVVNRIETEYLNSINTAENMLYDKYTGSVLLSNLTDEYGDKLFSMSYPSHWYHKELRDLYVAEDRVFNGMSIVGASLDLSSVSEDVFTPGDRIFVSTTQGGASAEAWILSITGNQAALIHESGQVYSGLSGNVDVRIVSSGRKNRLMENIQTITTKRPIDVPVSGAFSFPENEIISSSVISYRNKNNIRCREDFEAPKQNNEVVLNGPFNPYLYGVKGDLVLDGQFAWQSERKNALHEHKTRFDGAYTDFIPFYKLSNGIWYKIDELNHPNHIAADEYQLWRKLGEVTRYDEYGKALESQDQINVHSSVLYGFNKELNLLPVAQAVNARQQEIAFDGFEDYSYYENVTLNNEERHFDFLESIGTNGVKINDRVRHSGLSSLEIDAGANAVVTKNIGTDCSSPVESTKEQFIAEECLCVIPFEPTAGEYIIGAWVKVGENRNTTQYAGVAIEVTISGQPPVFVYPKGAILDGWQRMEGEFTIPSSVSGSTITVRLLNNTKSDQVYFDDLRIHPFLAGMTTTVYDPKTLLPMATHDGYNFTTYFNYDENLNQVRVRVETVEGIQTISETEFGGQKSFNINSKQ